jgi:hypothetical protein
MAGTEIGRFDNNDRRGAGRFGLVDHGGESDDVLARDRHRLPDVSPSPQVFHQLVEGFRADALGSVTERLIGGGMDLDE